MPISHGLKFCHLDLIESFECCLWEIFSKLLTFCFETKTPNECLSYRLCINGLVFTSGIWIYKVKHNSKISWEVPRFQNKQIQACLFQLRVWSKCTLFPREQSFCSLLLLNHIFSLTPPPPPRPIQSSLYALNSPQWKWKKLSGEKKLTGVAVSAVTLVQCWHNWTIVKFGRFVTDVRTIGPLSILPQFCHHFTIGCHPPVPLHS